MTEIESLRAELRSALQQRDQARAALEAVSLQMELRAGEYARDFDRVRREGRIEGASVALEEAVRV